MGGIDTKHIKELLQKNEYEEVIYICNENLIGHYNIELYLYRAIAYLNLKSYSKFIIDSNKVLDFEGDDSIIYNSKGIISFYLKSYIESISYLDKAIQLDKHCSESYYYRGLSKLYIMSNYINIINNFYYVNFDNIINDFKMAKKLEYKYANIDNYLNLLYSYSKLYKNNIEIRNSILYEIYHNSFDNNIRFIDYYNKLINEMVTDFNLDLLLDKYLINDNKYKNEIYKNKTDDPHIARLKITYDGEMFDNHQMNASDLSLIVSSVEKIFLKINEIVNKNFVKVDVKVDANFVKGSFGIDFIIITQLVNTTIESLNSEVVEAIINAVGLAGILIGLIKLIIHKNRKKIKLKMKESYYEKIKYDKNSKITSKIIKKSNEVELDADDFYEDIVSIINKNNADKITMETDDDKEIFTKEDIDKNNFDDSSDDEKN